MRFILLPQCSAWLLIPPEIISIILELLWHISPPRRLTSEDISELESQHRDDPTSTNGLKLKPSMLHLGWIYATQFCHKWRAVALGHKGLWTFIDPYLLGEPWTYEMIRRSNGAALAFYQDYTNHRRFRAPELPRARDGGLLFVRDIQIYNYVYPFGSDAVFRLLLHPQPALEDFTFHAAPMQNGGFVSMPFAVSLFGGWAGSLPCLSSVSFRNTIPPWNSPAFAAASLTSLCIGFMPVPAREDETRAAVENRVSGIAVPLLMTLQAMSHSLESLELVNCIALGSLNAYRATSDPNATRAVTLHCLQSLKVTCSTLEVFFHFVDHLIFRNALTELKIDAESLLPGKPERAYDRVMSLVQKLCFPQATSPAPPSESHIQDAHSHTFDKLSIKHLIPYSPPRFVRLGNPLPGALSIHLNSTTPPTCACYYPPDVTLSLPLATTEARVIPPICNRFLDILPVNWEAIKTLGVIAEYPITINGIERPFVAWSVSEADKLLGRMSGLTNIYCGSEIASTALDVLLKSHRHPRPLPLDLDQHAYDDFDATRTVRSRIRLLHLQNLYLVDPSFQSHSFTYSDLAHPEDLAAWKLVNRGACIGAVAGGDIPTKLNQVIKERGELGIPIGTVHLWLGGNQFQDRRITVASNRKRVLKALSGAGVTRVVAEDVEVGVRWNTI